MLRGPRARRLLRRLLIVTIALSFAAALLGAALFGWALHDWSDSDEPLAATVTVDRPVSVVHATEVDADVMPNVLGLNEATADQVLDDAGVDLRRVAREQLPYAGPRGIVIDQSPPSGSPVASEDLRLAISVAARMPKLVGSTLAVARNELAEVGARVLVKTRYEPGAAEATVLETQPSAGAPLVDRATLVVAEPPSSVFLTQLRPIESSCGTETVNVAGIERKEALVCGPGEGSPAVMEFVLNRRVASFGAVIGLGDRGGTDAQVGFGVYVDGRRAFSRTLAFGQAEAVSVPAAGALRIRIEAVVASTGSSGVTPQAVFAGARFLGGRSAIDALIAESNR